MSNKVRTWKRVAGTMIAGALVAMAAGCGSGVVEGHYEPFDADAVLVAAPLAAAFADINAIRGEAAFGPASFTDIDLIWTAELETDVSAAAAGHDFVSEGAGLGAALAADIDAAIAAGTADMNVGAQGQIIDKLLQRFFLETMAGGLLDDSEEGWDRAFAFYGRSADGTESTLLANTARKRDENFGTSYNDDIWQAFIDGRNAVVTDDHDGFHEAEEAIDLMVMEVFALSTQRELRGLEDADVLADLDKHEEKLLEGLIFWETIRDHAATLDTSAAEAVDAAFAAADPRDPATVDGVAVADMILTIYGLNI